MQTISRTQLQKMVLDFCDLIISQKNEINSINVFPVPDQDTGSNLANTFKEVKKNIEGKEFASIKELQHVVEETALISAQGNSGIIFVGFFSGFFQPLHSKNELTKEDLLQAFKSGALKARNSIEKPMKGTILDVIDASVESLEQNSTADVGWDILLHAMFEAASVALENTREAMAHLTETRVVDAGGLAFVVLIESFYTTLTGKKLAIEAEKEQVEVKSNAASITKNRYEVVTIIKDSLMTHKEVEEMLQPIGDSIDILELSGKLKIHIHTDQPHTVKEMLSALGDTLLLQISDMKEEKILELVDLTK
jgi:dihydroxyacetone kinase-like predicted kinase